MSEIVSGSNPLMPLLKIETVCVPQTSMRKTGFLLILCTLLFMKVVGSVGKVEPPDELGFETVDDALSFVN